MAQNDILAFRCGDDLADRARRKASRQGVALSVALRALVSEYVRGSRPTMELARTLSQLVTELVAQGRNLNQVTRAINAGTAPAGFEQVTAKLVDMLSRLMSLVSPLAQPQPRRRRRAQ